MELEYALPSCRPWLKYGYMVITGYGFQPMVMHGYGYNTLNNHI